MNDQIRRLMGSPARPISAAGQPVQVTARVQQTQKVESQASAPVPSFKLEERADLPPDGYAPLSPANELVKSPLNVEGIGGSLANAAQPPPPVDPPKMSKKLSENMHRWRIG